MKATLDELDGRPVLRMERRLSHPREKVWRAITEPERLGLWFPFTVAEMDLRVGGKIVFGGGMTLDAEITELDPPRVFAFVQRSTPEMPREGDNLLRFELSPEEGGGCLLVFTQVFDDRPAAASYASGWQVCLGALDAVVAGRSPEWPEGNFPELHQAYVEAFGLTEAVAGRADGPGGRQVRFERQLTRPVEEVWNAVGAAAATIGAPVPDRLGEGTVTAVRTPGAPGAGPGAETPAYVEFTVAPAGPERPGAIHAEDGRRVRWELSRGTGHGARLVVTDTGATGHTSVLEEWRDRIETLARDLVG
ncbi:SRPBCC family protein [Microbispora triticiradicis]|uniref:SRPBCC family protein n=1 Tax=Microbispora triticiradicis TaxID=2200763 RepID=A0A5R8ZLB6_9ACTN|nr:SRPBCC family protein [Microbispora fusca]TLP66568.1 SRPBCC family protein [Microbispora fusca]